jgi:hypothetical protein
VIEIVDERRSQTESRIVESEPLVFDSYLSLSTGKMRGPLNRFSTSEYIDQGDARRRRYLVQSSFRLFDDRYDSDRTRGECNEREIPFGTASGILGSCSY